MRNIVVSLALLAGVVSVDLRALYQEPAAEFHVGIREPGQPAGAVSFWRTCAANEPCMFDVWRGKGYALYRDGGSRTIWVAP
jgi:hypothetical protein